MRKPGKVKQALQTEELVLLIHASLPVRSAETSSEEEKNNSPELLLYADDR